ncbi:MAG: hypothetical protein V7L23_07185 [Nostoc sp.]|uniref:hypothetical protein n=1 Tax=Nostoc sp. TaxID=1180 RepID=UPI002FF2AC5E
MTQSLEHLQKHKTCYRCNSPKVDYEANDHQRQITFIEQNSGVRSQNGLNAPLSMYRMNFDRKGG